MIGKNNPFNIRFSHLNKWRGMTGQTKGFCDFESVDYAVRAVYITIFRSYARRNVVTIADIIKRYAPPKENDTPKYVDFMARKMSLFPWDTVPVEKRYLFLHYLSVYEGNPVSVTYIIYSLMRFDYYEAF